MFKKFLSFCFVCGVLNSIFFSLNSYALRDVESLFTRLKDSSESWMIRGKVCEQVARIILEDLYPSPNYEVITDVYIYDVSNPRIQTVGEFDALVEDKRDEKIKLVAEVKCWSDHDLRNAFTRATKQLNGLYTAIHSDEKIKIYNPSTKTQFFPSQFKDLSRNDFKTIAQPLGQAFGFDMSLELTLQELMLLREALLGCQDRGECPSPPESPRARKRRKSAELRKNGRGLPFIDLNDNVPVRRHSDPFVLDKDLSTFLHWLD